MEEINYAENGGWMRYVMFKPFTETIGSDRIWKEDEGFQMYPYSDKIVGGTRRPVRHDVSKQFGMGL